MNPSEYDIFIEDLSDESFERVLERTNTTHVFLTVITSTFPRSLELASIASMHACTVVLGGLFATLNADVIATKFPVFDYVIKGTPSRDLKTLLETDVKSPRILNFPKRYSMRPLHGIMTEPKIMSAFRGQRVCYELGNGCHQECSFCSLRPARGSSSIIRRHLKEASNDLEIFAQHWTELKLIDDDILYSAEILPTLRLGEHFREVVAETRVDRLFDRSNVELLRRSGITHVLFGVETFNSASLALMRKPTNTLAKSRIQEVHEVLRLLAEVGIVARPILMLTAPGMTRSDLRVVESVVKDWTPANGVELLLSFYTPHPGTEAACAEPYLITNDLARFDHLHPVCLFESLGIKNLDEILDTYGRIVEVTRSERSNPPVKVVDHILSEYECFFPSRRTTM